MTADELQTAIKNLESGIAQMSEEEKVQVSKKIFVNILENYKELLKYKNSHPNKNKLLSSLKYEITKLNEGLFWANKNSVKKLSYDEANDIKSVLSEAYEYIKTN